MNTPYFIQWCAWRFKNGMVLLALLIQTCLPAIAGGSVYNNYFSLRASSPQGTFVDIRRSAPGAPIVFEYRLQFAQFLGLLPGSGAYDFYFGGRLPNGQIFSWVDDESRPGSMKLVGGYAPAQRDQRFADPDVVPSVPIFIDWRRRALYQFGAQNELGTYLIFAIMVPSGANPQDTENWLAQDSMFLLLQP